jgi:hypothetical protein
MNVITTQAGHSKLLAKHKEPSFLKIAPPKVLVDKEGWKVFMLKCIYAARISAFIQTIWLKGSCLTYVAKKLMIIVMFIETKMQINWAGIMFNNFHNRLKDLGGPHRSDLTKDA